MKKTIATLLCATTLSLAATSCQKEELEAGSHAWKASGDWSGQVFSAAFSSDNGKTSMNDQYQIIWTPNDQIRIKNDAGQVLNYNIIEIDETGTRSSFSVPAGSAELEGSSFVATYPTTFDGESITLPYTQTYDATKHLVNFPMYASSTSHSLQFHNLCGVLELTLQQSNIVVKEIIISTDQNITGNFSIGEEGDFKCVKAEGATGNNRTSVKLDCGNGVSISNATKFYIYLPVASFTKFDIEVVTTSGATFTAKKNSNDAMPFQRNRVKTVSLNNFSFHTPPTNAVKGLYSVSDNQRVYIAHGNLYWRNPTVQGYYYTSRNNGFWDFYDQQYGCYHKTTQTDQAGDTLSFFPFGYNNSKDHDYVGSARSFQDWGTVAEVISKAIYASEREILRDEPSGHRGIGEHWRTITGDEWHYLLFQRPMVFGAPRFAAVVVTLANGRTTKNCLILYPDRYNPSDLAPKPNVRGEAQPVTWAEYQQYESLGCAFLPANGFRNNGAAINSNAADYELVCLYHSSSRLPNSDSQYSTHSRGIVGDLTMPADRGDNMAMGKLAFSCGHNVRLMMNEEFGPVESRTPIL